MSTESDEYREIDIKIEIQKTLISINNTTLKIKNELDIINDLVKKNGQLHIAVIDANKTLTTIAQNMDININNILNNDESESELQFNLNNLSSAAFKEKLLEYSNNM
ncbi:hypothetical protein HZU73_06448 [Apis mellifera caucasica]|nr:hypothetical protein HZU73_06448 [Apis mellifera caucasica]KAG9436088.1 hypothetical protein HZU67_02511 [Apis mellifera carnica]